MHVVSHDYILMKNDRYVLYMFKLNIGLSLPDYFSVMLRSKIVSSVVRRDMLLRGSKLKAREAVEMGFDSMMIVQRVRWRRWRIWERS